ncbi:LacI family DNA-binding transcriptional regulator [Cryobacterium flavum]|uniref:LacI family DNA-binding transcriptional regulator n=1 Tax=Cryobacterium flavum TaxID=1424659 RepID=A0ABY2HXR3_9MICO|nr:LacI family DNA-binding transcriptional regulator [Cryobacterium flavum]
MKPHLVCDFAEASARSTTPRRQDRRKGEDVKHDASRVVARSADVSQTTVSRFLSSSPSSYGEPEPKARSN